MISVPTESAASSCARCNGSAWSGNAASRPYMRPSQSSGVGGKRAIARRRRSRKVRASRRRVRSAGDSGGNRRNESARDAAACDDRQRGIVELRRVVAHLVRGREERHEVEGHGGEHGDRRRLPARAMAKPAGTRKRPMATQKAGNVSSPGSTANLMIAATNDADGGAERERDSAAVGQIASRRKQQDHDRGKDDGRGAVRPCGHDPEKLDGTDRDERASRIDESRQPIGHAQPEAATAGSRSARSIDEQRQSHRARAKCRPAPWPSRRRAAAAMACRPAGRAASAPPPRKRGAGPWDQPSSVPASLAPAPIAARAECCAGWSPPPAEPASSGKRPDASQLRANHPAP